MEASNIYYSFVGLRPSPLRSFNFRRQFSRRCVIKLTSFPTFLKSFANDSPIPF